ncbi:50S ribosome-binding GTPase [Candidatus Woesearchaeota archaeon]|nr:50S ribosome-binding GTPase [Candidatus Woesearchaeota archaeon]
MGFFDYLKSILKIFQIKKTVRLGLYGPVNAGKSSLANKISLDWLGEEMSEVSKIPHETREIKVKEKVKIRSSGKELDFNLIDTPGIATKVDYEDFLKYKLSKSEAKKRAKEATQGVIEAIKWLENVDCVLVVLDATENPYDQVNVTIIGNLAARNIPVLIVANKIDLKSANIKRIESAFPQYNVVGVSALKGTNIENFYKELFRTVR